jgi:hypothetical protein
MYKIGPSNESKGFIRFPIVDWVSSQRDWAPNISGSYIRILATILSMMQEEEEELQLFSWHE